MQSLDRNLYNYDPIFFFFQCLLDSVFERDQPTGCNIQCIYVTYLNKTTTTTTITKYVRSLMEAYSFYISIDEGEYNIDDGPRVKESLNGGWR